MSSPHPATPSRAKLLTQNDLRTLHEDLFRLELATLRQLIDHGIDPGRIALVANISRTIEAVEQLRLPTRERP
jgi:hypothetical protein